MNSDLWDGGNASKLEPDQEKWNEIGEFAIGHRPKGSSKGGQFAPSKGGKGKGLSGAKKRVTGRASKFEAGVKSRFKPKKSKKGPSSKDAGDTPESEAASGLIGASRKIVAGTSDGSIPPDRADKLQDNLDSVFELAKKDVQRALPRIRALNRSVTQ